MSTAAVSTDALRHRLVEDLTEGGFLRTQPWLNAFRAVPREGFVRRFRVASPTDAGPVYDLEETSRRGEALEAVYSDASLLTQHDGGGTATSSSTAPSLMALMLEALQIDDGMRVLEVGTGTGYNAGLLAHRLGDDRITTVDLDPGLVRAATRALLDAGYAPTTVCGDGAEGFAARAPYDRLIATCGVDRVPKAWLEQVRPGGMILVNVGFGLVRLTVAPDGSASGQFLDYAAFMSMRRSTDDLAVTVHDVQALATGTGEQRTTSLPSVLDEREMQFLRSVLMPGVRQIVEHRSEGLQYVLADPASRSWARARVQGEGTATVTESGPRHLWTELVAIAEDWVASGRPAITAYGLTVGVAGEHELRLADAPRRWRL